MKKKLALAVMLCAIVSILSLNFGPIFRNVAASGGNTNDNDDAPIEVHGIYGALNS